MNEEYERQRERSLNSRIGDAEIEQIVESLDLDEAMVSEFNRLLELERELSIQYQAIKQKRELYLKGGYG